MAVSGLAIYEVRTDGSDTNGGGFVPGSGGTDRSQQAAAHCSGTTMTIHASTTTDVLPTGYTPVAADVGNIVRIRAGTGFTVGYYQIMSIQSGYWRLDRAAGTASSTGGSWAMGGALASIGMLGLAMSANYQTAYIKAGTYTVTSTAQRVSGGIWCPSTGYNMLIVGYDTNRNIFNSDTKPIVVFGAGVTGAALFSGGTVSTIVNLELDGNGQTGSSGISGGYMAARNCHFKNFVGTACSGTAYYCTATANTGANVFANGSYFHCVAWANPGGTTNHRPIFVGANLAVVFGCIAMNNSGTGTDGFHLGGCLVTNCVSYGNGRHGFFNYANTANQMVENCIAVNNAGWGFYSEGTLGPWRWMKKCASYNNTLGHYSLLGSTPSPTYDFIVLSGNPFVDAANGNFSLNDAVFGGHQLRSVALPTAMLGSASATPNYMDVGAVRHQDPTVGGSNSGGAYTFIG